MDQLALPLSRPPDFHCRIKVQSHISKKNSRPIRINPKTRQRFLGKSASLEAAEQWLLLHFLKARRETKLSLPVQTDVHACFRFIFDDYYTKAGVRRKNLPDLSNLVQLPEDMLQKSGIIENDSLIVSLDGSRRWPGPENILEVFLWVDQTEDNDEG